MGSLKGTKKSKLYSVFFVNTITGWQCKTQEYSTPELIHKRYQLCFPYINIIKIERKH